MRVEFGYIVRPDAEKKDDPFTGLSIAQGDISFQIKERDPNGEWLATGSCTVSPAVLEFVPANTTIDGRTFKKAGFIVKRRSEVGEMARSAVEALAFCERIPLTLVLRPKADRLIPESPEEERQIAVAPRVMPNRVYVNLSVWPHEVPRADLKRVAEALLRKQPGIALYNEALKAARPVAKFRDLWRVLESAFGCADDDLVQLLASYGPARQMEFTEEELSDLHLLRGMASHAAGKKQAAVVRYVAREAERRLSRLRSLVGCVLLTKKTWGVPTLVVEPLVPLPGYQKPSGERLSLRRR